MQLTSRASDRLKPSKGCCVSDSASGVPLASSRRTARACIFIPCSLEARDNVTPSSVSSKRRTDGRTYEFFATISSHRDEIIKAFGGTRIRRARVLSREHAEACPSRSYGVSRVNGAARSSEQPSTSGYLRSARKRTHARA